MKTTRKGAERAQRPALGPKFSVRLTVTVTERQLQHVLAQLRYIRIPFTIDHKEPEIKEPDA